MQNLEFWADDRQLGNYYSGNILRAEDGLAGWGIDVYVLFISIGPASPGGFRQFFEPTRRAPGWCSR
jgi:hypothetical protein